METELSFDKEHAPQYLGAALIAVTQALDDAIEALAEIKGTEDTSWIDELHEKAVVSAKGTVTEDISVTVEAPAMKFGIDMINTKFDGYRRRFSNRA